MNEISNTLDQLGDGNFAFLSLKEEFLSTQSRLENPLLVNEELEYQKEIFSKLKFQYLEQETRDKFLRKISETSSNDISSQDINEIQSDALASKNELKQLKRDLHSNIDNLELLSHDVVRLHQEFNEKLQRARQRLGETSEIEAKLAAKVNTYSLDRKALIESLDLEEGHGLEESVAELQKKSENKRVELQNVNKTLSTKQEAHNNYKQQIANFNAEIDKLNLDVQEYNPDQSLSDTQLFAKWCKQMNELLLRFTNVKNLKLEYDDRFKLSFETEQGKSGNDKESFNDTNEPRNGHEPATSTPALVFDKSLRLVQYNGIEDSLLDGIRDATGLPLDEFLRVVAQLIREYVT